MKQYQDLAENIAKQAGAIILKHFKTNVKHRKKSDQTLVSIADEQINQLVIEEIHQRFPSHSIIGEEASSHQDSEYVWLCDPIDGTHPFIKGVPVSVFSLALTHNHQPILGVVYDPFTDRLYSATSDQPSSINGQKISVSSRSLSREATINIEWWPEAEYDVDTALHQLSQKTGVYVLHLGCVINGACLVASGQFEACIFPGTKNKAVDIAAAKVIVESAGGTVTNIFGQQQNYQNNIQGAIISNGLIHQTLVKHLQTYIS